jgi:uncharacterized protein YbjT (DUF2867 family)
MKRAVVGGATGFLGAAVVAALSSNEAGEKPDSERRAQSRERLFGMGSTHNIAPLMD